MTTKKKDKGRGNKYCSCGVQRGSEGDMNALLTFCRRRVGWRRGSSTVEDDKHKAVEWE